MLDLGEGIEEEEEGEGGEGKVAIDEKLWERERREEEARKCRNGTKEKSLLYNERFTWIGLYKVVHIANYAPTPHQSWAFNIILLLCSYFFYNHDIF